MQVNRLGGWWRLWFVALVISAGIGLLLIANSTETLYTAITSADEPTQAQRDAAMVPVSQSAGCLHTSSAIADDMAALISDAAATAEMTAAPSTKVDPKFELGSNIEDKPVLLIWNIKAECLTIKIIFDVIVNALVIPIFLLICGLTFVWVRKGFRNKNI